MKILATKWFRKWIKKAKIEIVDLINSANIININPQTSISLGSGLYKVRIKKEHQGKRGGYRTLLIFKQDELVMYVYGFSKSEKDNLDNDELKMFKKLSKDILNMKNKELLNQTFLGSFIDLEKNHEK